MDYLFGKMDDGTVYLTTASSEMELGLIQSMLTDNNIPSIYKDREAGAYLRAFGGFSVFGTDVFVSKDDYPAAKELIDAYIDAAPAEDAPPMDETEPT